MLNSYYCNTCQRERYSPVCPECLFQATGVQIEPFTVHISFIVSFPVGNDLVDFEITPVGKNGINIRTDGDLDSVVTINRVGYRMAAYVERKESGELELVNNVYLSRPGYFGGVNSVAAHNRAYTIAMQVAEFIYSGAFDDLLDAAEIIELTRKYEKADTAYVEALESAISLKRESMRYHGELTRLGANFPTTHK